MDEPERPVEHVLAGMPKPSWTGVTTPLAFVELGDQEPSMRFQHAVHLAYCSPLIVLSHVMQREGACDGVKGGVRKGKLLRKSNLEGDYHASLACLTAGTVDHLDCCIYAVDGAGGSYPLGERDCQTARSTANVEDMVARPQLQIVDDHGT
jgi:hypothetical protein